jgi:cellulose synthase/poly-beta-1,6-N-acetylglucosamine synthase-like glycosyltransferase
MFVLECVEAHSRPRIATVIPAHNEEAGIGDTVRDAVSQLVDGDRVLVIADNCSDNTAEVARRCGAEVAVRNNLELRGKSYALEFALEVLSDDPPEVVIFVDADCRLSPNSLTDLAVKAVSMDRPVQGSYIFGGKEGSVASNLASSLTLRFKNHIRPLGSARLGMPCQLTGSGMAFPWHMLQGVNVANGSLTEDAELGVDLALAGYPPIFCAQAKIDGSVPKAWDAHVQQRRRWEQGYLQSILTNAPKMFFKSITNGQPSLLWSALDLCIAPLALLGLVWFITFCFAVVTVFLGGSWLPLAMLSIGAVAMGACIVLGWFVHCRKEVGIKSLLSIPWFVLRKVTIYASLLFKREKVWLRTERD